jgi:hypothetical protein
MQNGLDTQRQPKISRNRTRSSKFRTGCTVNLSRRVDFAPSLINPIRFSQNGRGGSSRAMQICRRRWGTSKSDVDLLQFSSGAFRQYPRTRIGLTRQIHPVSPTSARHVHLHPLVYVAIALAALFNRAVNRVAERATVEAGRDCGHELLPSSRFGKHFFVKLADTLGGYAIKVFGTPPIQSRGTPEEI